MATSGLSNDNCPRELGQLSTIIPQNHSITVTYMYVYVHTFLICMRVLVICDRNSIAMKWEEFPAWAVEV